MRMITFALLMTLVHCRDSMDLQNRRSHFESKIETTEPITVKEAPAEDETPVISDDPIEENSSPSANPEDVTSAMLSPATIHYRFAGDTVSEELRTKCPDITPGVSPLNYQLGIERIQLEVLALSADCKERILTNEAKWISSQPNVAEFDKNKAGQLLFVRDGATSISALMADGARVTRDGFSINVIEQCKYRYKNFCVYPVKGQGCDTFCANHGGIDPVGMAEKGRPSNQCVCNH